MTTPPVTLQPMPLEVVREPAELEAFLEDALRVCSPGRMLVVGVGAERVVRALLQRGIHTVGLETCQGTQFEDAAFESTLVFGALDGFDLVDSEEAVKELHRVTRGTVIVISAIKAVCAVSHRPSGGWREWWDGQFIGAGFRKHPLRSWMIPSDTLEHDRAELTMIFEPIPEHLPGASMLWDATREVGLASDSWLAGYEIAASHIRPWDVVIDLACGPGGGIHLMRRFSRGGRFIGIDRDAPSIEYARAHFAGRSKNIEFQVAAPVDALLGLGDNSVHFIVCSGDQARTAAESKEWQEECLRVLVPGGRMLLSLATDEIPLWQTTAEKFLVEKVFHFNSGDADGASGRRLLLMKDPVRREVPAYTETVFGNLKNCSHISVQYAHQYRNPFIPHALMHASFRITATSLQVECAGRLLAEAPADSVDAGAATCLLLYRMMDGPLPDGLSETAILESIDRYLVIPNATAGQRRWQISLSSALGAYHLRQGDFPKARKAFAFCTTLDPFFCLSIAGKAVEAWFWLGWLAFNDGERETAEQMWRAGLNVGDRIVRRGLDETLMEPSFPNLFDWGDGMRELTLSLEAVTQCANGLHCARLQREGISFRWDLIPNTFRTQRDNRERLLRQAQFRVGKLCREIDEARAQLRERTAELDTLRLEKEVSASFANTRAPAWNSR